MRLSFSRRILLSLVPLLLLIVVLGGAAVVLLHRLGGRIDAILRENYDSVRYMQELREVLERIDTSFQLALAGQKDADARKGEEQNWEQLAEWVSKELGNITLPGEKESAEKLDGLTREYRRLNAELWKLPPGSEARRDAYFRKHGLASHYEAIRKVSREILLMNQQNMEDAEDNARQLARNSLLGFAAGLLLATTVGLWLAHNAIRAALRRIQLVTHSAQAIGEGNLDQVVPVLGLDELGGLASAFNGMARQLREYRQAGMSQLLRAQQTSQATIDSFPDPVLVVDPFGKIEMANPAARRLVGTGPIWHPPGALADRLGEAINQDRPYLPEGFSHAIRLSAGGHEGFYLPRILPIFSTSSGAIGAAVLLQDVTRFRLLDQVKSDLVATVSHELKTPLTSIRLALHLLLEETVGPLSPKQTELLLDARDNGERLLRMVNNLLDLARLEKGKQVELIPEKIEPVLRSAAELVLPRAEDKGIQLELAISDDLPEVAADPEQLSHAINNLLDNAVIYTPAGGRIKLSASARNGTVEIAVADTGVGIAAEHLPHLFDKFYRIPGQTAEGGTGLGLAIVREVATAHGGNVSCDSKPGEGSVFRISLPVAQPAGCMRDLS